MRCGNMPGTAPCSTGGASATAQQQRRTAHLHQPKRDAQRGPQRRAQHNAAGGGRGRLYAAVHCSRGQARCGGWALGGRLQRGGAGVRATAQELSTRASHCSLHRLFRPLTRVPKRGAGCQAAMRCVQKIPPPPVHPAQHLHNRQAERETSNGCSSAGGCGLCACVRGGGRGAGRGPVCLADVTLRPV